MAKIVILMGRGMSGKTKTINKIGEILGLTKYETRNKAGYPNFITWVGEAQEIFLKTGSIQEDEISRLRDILAQTGSIQEKEKAILDKVIEATKKWIEYLQDKPNAIAIIPFTLTGKDAMENLILQPLGLFRNSGNDIKLIYLKKDNINEKTLVEEVVEKAKPDFIIKSVKDEQERQAQELLDYLNLKPIKKSELAPIDQFI